MNLSHSSFNQCALIVEGGAMRSVFSAGLLDGFLENQFNPFDFYIGVSAGAYNLAAYLAGASGIGLRVFRDLATSSNFINYPRFIRGGHLLDLDWLIANTLTDAHLDTTTVCRHGKPLYICVTDVATGQAVYLNTTPANLEEVVKASTALPLLYRDFPEINGRQMTDGGVADGIPVAEAMRLGAKRLMVIRSRAKSYVKRDTLWHQFIRRKMRHYPALTQTMRERVKRFEDVMQLIRNPPRGVKILEICPPENFSIGRFSRSRKQLQRGYDAGISQADETIQRWRTL